MKEKKWKTSINTFVSAFKVLWFATSLFNDTSTFSSFAFLFLLQFLSGFFTQEQLQNSSFVRKIFHGVKIKIVCVNLLEASSFSLESWNLSWPSWLLRLPPYAYALQHACAQSQPVWPSLPIGRHFKLIFYSQSRNLRNTVKNIYKLATCCYIWPYLLHSPHFIISHG